MKGVNRANMDALRSTRVNIDADIVVPANHRRLKNAINNPSQPHMSAPM